MNDAVERARELVAKARAHRGWYPTSIVSEALPLLAALVEEVERLGAPAESEPQSCRDDDGCPTEGAVLRREWRELRAERDKLQSTVADQLATIKALNPTGRPTSDVILQLARLEEEAERKDHQPVKLLICAVTPTDDGWDIRLGPDDNDPWVTWHGPEPQVGQVATVLPPVVVSIEPGKE